MKGAAHEEGTVSFGAFARILGERSPSYVTQLKEAGRLVLTADGKRVRVKESLELIRSTADPSKAGVAARHAANRQQGAGEGTAPAPIPPPEPNGAADEGDDAPNEAEGGHAARRARHLADKAEWDAAAAKRDYLVSMGQLLAADQVVAATSAAVAAFRSRIEELPADLAPQLAPITDEAKIRAMLTDEFERALQELSRQFGGLAKAGAAT